MVFVTAACRASDDREQVYPWDTEEHKADSTLYTGVASTFERLGFEVVQRRVPHKPRMLLSLTGPLN